jgi:hypothetical protein
MFLHTNTKHHRVEIVPSDVPAGVFVCAGLLAFGHTKEWDSNRPPHLTRTVSLDNTPDKQREEEREKTRLIYFLGIP